MPIAPTPTRTKSQRIADMLKLTDEMVQNLRSCERKTLQVIVHPDSTPEDIQTATQALRNSAAAVMQAIERLLEPDIAGTLRPASWSPTGNHPAIDKLRTYRESIRKGTL